MEANKILGQEADVRLFLDEIDAATAGERWIEQFASSAEQCIRSENEGAAIPRIKWCAYFDGNDRLVAAYMLNRDLKNWTQLTKIDARAALASQAAPQEPYGWIGQFGDIWNFLPGAANPWGPRVGINAKPVYAAPQPTSAPTATDSYAALTNRKTESIVESGYQVVGYVLQNDKHDYCISAQSAVRWLPSAHYQRLMHEQDGSLFAAPAPAVAVDALHAAHARIRALESAGMQLTYQLANAPVESASKARNVDYVRRQTVMDHVVAWRHAFDNAPKFDVRTALATQPVQAPVAEPVAACWSCKREYKASQRAEADGDCPHCGAEIDEEAAPVANAGQARIVSHEDMGPLGTLTVTAYKLAQAAQPHDEDAAIRLRAICDRLGIGSHIPQDNATLWGAAFSVLGQIRAALDRQAAQPAGDERAAFEAWARSNGCDSSDMARSVAIAGEYAWGTTQAKWCAWQARAAIAAQQPAQHAVQAPKGTENE